MTLNYPVSFHSTCLFLALMAATIAKLHPCLAATATMVTASTTTKPGCPSQCGNITIPYPFGFGGDSSCFLNSNYNLFCHNNSKPFLNYTGNYTTAFEILDISETGIRIRNPQVAFVCFNSLGNKTTAKTDSFYSRELAPGSPFTVSPTSNKLVVIGCREIGHFYTDVAGHFANSCSSFCSAKEDVVAGQCKSSGCCEASVPHGSKNIEVKLDSQSNNTNVSWFNPCGYAFLAEEGKFTFAGVSDLSDPHPKFISRVMETVPLVIDWVIGNGTCKDAQQNRSTYACMGNTTCSDGNKLDSGIGGYKCFCQSGFQGNPYLSPGCTDINECEDPKLSDCSGRCKNTVGSFSCTCPPGYTGDGRRNGSGCSRTSFLLKLSLGISSCILVLVIGLSWLYSLDKKRKLMKTKNKFFQQNGGWLLQEKLSMINWGTGDRMKIFTEEDLEAATNNFDETHILGSGGYGTVYKGTLPNKRVVAIKKSKLGDPNQIEQFINELVILGHTNHRNVVKLYGCCLETEVPLLVYEFISNGILYCHIQNFSNSEGSSSWQLSWKDCLRIASQAADALSYLHSAAFPPIVHRDIKSHNILLDEDFNAKIGDFGASRAMDASRLCTLVQGTIGYLDPEYLKTSLLTEKSDVYSFGVVLAELLTRQKPISLDRQEEDRNLGTYFVKSLEQDKLFDILYPKWLKEATSEELVSMASITLRCLKLSGKDRPTMKTVSMELEAIKKLAKEDNQRHYNSATNTTTVDYPFTKSGTMHYTSTSEGMHSTTTMDEERDLFPAPR